MKPKGQVSCTVSHAGQSVLLPFSQQASVCIIWECAVYRHGANVNVVGKASSMDRRAAQTGCEARWPMHTF